MKFRKFLTGLICLILVTILAASSTVFAEEVSEQESTELSVSSDEMNDVDFEESSVQNGIIFYIVIPNNFRCVEGSESNLPLRAVVNLGPHLVRRIYYANMITWSTPDSDIISITDPSALETTIVGLKPGRATVNLTVHVGHITETTSTTITVGEKSEIGINNPGPTGPNTPSSPHNSNYEEKSEESSKVYRLYLAANNEHLYTTDANEVRELEAAGWTNENVAWNAPATGDPVYRLYSPVTNEHLYTKDKSEVENLEASGWTVDNNGQPLFNSGGSKPVYRLYDEGTKRHHLTASKAEYDALSSQGWSSEGTALNAES